MKYYRCTRNFTNGLRCSENVNGVCFAGVFDPCKYKIKIKPKNKDKICNRCGNKLDVFDINEDFSMRKILGYGTFFDGDILDIRLCCDCMEDIIDQCKVSPIVPVIHK